MRTPSFRIFGWTLVIINILIGNLFIILGGSWIGGLPSYFGAAICFGLWIGSFFDKEPSSNSEKTSGVER